LTSKDDRFGCKNILYYKQYQLDQCVNVIRHFRYKPASEDQLLKAFRVLDNDEKGFLTQDQLSKLLMEEGV